MPISQAGLGGGTVKKSAGAQLLPRGQQQAPGWHGGRPDGTSCGGCHGREPLSVRKAVGEPASGQGGGKGEEAPLPGKEGPAPRGPLRIATAWGQRPQLFLF